MGCGCKKKSVRPATQARPAKSSTFKSVETPKTETNVPLETKKPLEANNVDNGSLINKITTRLKDITG